MVGIAGPIAAGKSTVSHFLVGMGAREIDADAVCHRYLREEEAISEIVKHFGTDILDKHGNPDRWKLGRIVFNEEKYVSILNRILHPFLMEEVEQEVEESREHGVMLVLNSALLFESGIDELCDYIITVTANLEVRRHRALTKRGWPPGEIKKRESYFIPLEEKIERSDFIIENNGNYEDLQKRTEEVFREIVNDKQS
ncbi:MAG: dephospho-CoA kinase [Planctomycetota bacterium]|nr:dephospho-CoA kinase [Planctomycetota bacterium]